jgi:hypothetical protein
MRKPEWTEVSKQLANINQYLDPVKRAKNVLVYQQPECVPGLVNEYSINDRDNEVGVYFVMTSFSPMGLGGLIQYTTSGGGVVFGRLFLLARSSRWDILTELLYPTNVQVRETDYKAGVFKNWDGGLIECPEHLEDFLSQVRI